MYQAEPDPYCYRGTDVLINKAGYRTAGALEEFETDATFTRANEPLPEGRFSKTHYCRVNHHLFQDVYGWARQCRTVRISKANSVFC